MHDAFLYIVTFIAALITLIAGFGLATILTPVFTLSFDVKLSILLVAIIHFFNNAFKLSLFWKSIDVNIIKRFGILSIIGALAGAFLQSYLFTDVLKSILGIVLIALGVAEFTPASISFRFPKKIDMIGGFFSGFLGGLVGNQGAIRSAFLLNYEIAKETYIATATIIALLIDVTRIPVYFVTQRSNVSSIPLWDVLFLILIAFLGTLAGKRILKYFSSVLFKKIVAGFVILIGITFTCHLI